MTWKAFKNEIETTEYTPLYINNLQFILHVISSIRHDRIQNSPSGKIKSISTTHHEDDDPNKNKKNEGGKRRRSTKRKTKRSKRKQKRNTKRRASHRRRR